MGNMLDYYCLMVSTNGPKITISHHTVAQLVEEVHANPLLGPGDFKLSALDYFDFDLVI